MSKIGFVKTGGLPGFLSSLRKMGQTVLAPMEKLSASKPAVVFQPWEEGMEVCLAKASVSPKEAVLPECQPLFSFKMTRDGGAEKMEFSENTAGAPTVVFACRPCDARGFETLDKPYLKGLYQDPYYKARRENLTVITLTCDSGCRTCFCHWVGIGPTSPAGCDILMTAVEGGHVLQAMTPKGAKLLEDAGVEDGAQEMPRADEVRKKAWASLVPAPDLKQAPEKLARVFNDIEFWHAMTDQCLSCGACTYFCPTCYCFNITDEGEAQSDRGGRRLRSWDNCMSSLYTREASGHNPRTQKAQRMRNRVSHKFWTFPENWGVFLCSGCGRCITHCPVCLDIRKIVLAAIEHAGNGPQ